MIIFSIILVISKLNYKNRGYSLNYYIINQNSYEYIYYLLI